MQLGTTHYWKSAPSSLHLQFRKKPKPNNQPKKPKPASPVKSKQPDKSATKKYYHLLSSHPTTQNLLLIFYSYEQVIFTILEVFYYGLRVTQRQESERRDKLTAFTEDK